MTDITGRDGFIICKALAYAIETIERLPEQWQEWSDKEDMKRLLDAITGGKPDFYRTVARSHIERRGVKVVAGQLDVADREEGGVVRGIFPPSGK
jgi:hypothetical protein